MEGDGAKGSGEGVPRDRERVAYAGRPGLVALLCKNYFLTLITLGFYRFWAATRLRRYLWGNISIAGDPLEYTGSGRELFLGFLVALAFLAPLTIGYAVLQRLALGNQPLALTLQAVYFAGLLIFFQVASFRARRYRLSRTRWRGIYAAQTGSATRYVGLWFAYALLTSVTLGIAMPWATVALQRYKISNTWFGDRAMTVEGRGRDLFWIWLTVLLFALVLPIAALAANVAALSQFAHLVATARPGAPPPFVALPHPEALRLLVICVPGAILAFAWYRVASFRYLASRTRLGSAELFSAARSGSVISSLLLCGLGFAAVMIGMALVIGLLAVTGVLISKSLFAGQTLPPATITAIVFAAAIPIYLLLFLLFQLIWYCWFWLPILRHIVMTLRIRNFSAVLDIGQSHAPRQKLGIADSFELGAF